MTPSIKLVGVEERQDKRTLESNVGFITAQEETGLGRRETLLFHSIIWGKQAISVATI